MLSSSHFLDVTFWNSKLPSPADASRATHAGISIVDMLEGCCLEG